MRGFRGIRFVEFLIVAFVGKAGFFNFSHLSWPNGKTTAAEILVNPAPRRRQATMTISLNPLRSTKDTLDKFLEYCSAA
jgi:hypothetical protein